MCPVFRHSYIACIVSSTSPDEATAERGGRSTTALHFSVTITMSKLITDYWGAGNSSQLNIYLPQWGGFSVPEKSIVVCLGIIITYYYPLVDIDINMNAADDSLRHWLLF